MQTCNPCWHHQMSSHPHHHLPLPLSPLFFPQPYANGLYCTCVCVCVCVKCISFWHSECIFLSTLTFPALRPCFFQPHPPPPLPTPTLPLVISRLMSISLLFSCFVVCTTPTPPPDGLKPGIMIAPHSWDVTRISFIFFFIYSKYTYIFIYNSDSQIYHTYYVKMGITIA